MRMKRLKSGRVVRLTAVAKQDREAALFAYDFGRDSWNSYIAVVNRAIPEKVGDKFEPLPS